MTKFDEKVDELVAKHPNLSKEEAIKIVTEKNERKKAKRKERTDKKAQKKPA